MTKLRRQHVVTMAPRNLKLGQCSKSLKLRVFGHRIGPKLKKPEGLFPQGESEELGIKKSE